MVAEIRKFRPEMDFRRMIFKNPLIYSAPDTSLDNFGFPGWDTLIFLCQATDQKISPAVAFRAQNSNFFYPNILNLKIDEDGTYRHVESFHESE